MENTFPQNHEVIRLWPEGAPGSQGYTQPEEQLIIHDGLKVIRNVSQPTLTVFPADPAKATGTAVIVCPGGAWHFLSIDMEGHDVARWLAARGVTAFVLRYRLIQTGKDLVAETEDHLSDRMQKMGPLLQALHPLMRADAERAMQIVRERAAEWGVRPDRVGMLGFSAGGDFTARAVLGNSPATRPSFAAPIYPAVFEEVVAPPDAPPLFLLCAYNDDMAVAGNMRLFNAWKAVKRPVEMHIYSTGGHGFGMTTQHLPSDRWIERFADWLELLYR